MNSINTPGFAHRRMSGGPLKTLTFKFEGFSYSSLMIFPTCERLFLMNLKVCLNIDPNSHEETNTRLTSLIN